LSVPQALDARALPGRGLQATVLGEALALGSSRLLRELGVDAGPLAAPAERLERDGRTVSWLIRKQGNSAELVGLLAFGDTLKPSARQAVDRLRQLGIRTALLTGDNRGSAQAVARALGIDDVHAEVLPADKAAIVAQWRAAPIRRSSRACSGPSRTTCSAFRSPRWAC
jgi:Cu+-exporting ATPase